jgi:hypothetical protein
MEEKKLVRRDDKYNFFYNADSLHICCFFPTVRKKGKMTSYSFSQDHVKEKEVAGQEELSSEMALYMPDYLNGKQICSVTCTITSMVSCRVMLVKKLKAVPIAVRFMGGQTGYHGGKANPDFVLDDVLAKSNEETGPNAFQAKLKNLKHFVMDASTELMVCFDYVFTPPVGTKSTVYVELKYQDVVLPRTPGVSVAANRKKRIRRRRPATGPSRMPASDILLRKLGLPVLDREKRVSRRTRHVSKRKRHPQRSSVQTNKASVAPSKKTSQVRRRKAKRGRAASGANQRSRSEEKAALADILKSFGR